jgi:hypothetical protein
LYEGCIDRIQTTVRSRNHSTFDEIAETALEKESAIFFLYYRYKSSNANSEGPKCSNCNKLGHAAGRCYLKGRKSFREQKYNISPPGQGVQTP